MDKFTTHTGIGVPLRRSNVDTDQIIPAVYLKRITRTGFEDALFAAWRNDPDFVLNQDAYRSGSVLADFFVQIIKNDPQLLRDYEDELDGMEHAIMAGSPGSAAHRINEMRSELRDLDDHYDHLMDLVRLLEENENGFFAEENLRYFRTVHGRLDKLRDQASSLRDQALQMRDLSKMRLDIQQNHIMTVLTVVTVIFAPLTLIVGWYGMNFTHMPELAWRWGYPLVFLVSLAVTLGLIIFFKRRKWL